MLRTKGVPLLSSRCGKGLPFSGWRPVCERDTFSAKGMWKGANFQNLILCERVPIFQRLVCERVRGPDLGRSIPHKSVGVTPSSPGLDKGKKMFVSSRPYRLIFCHVIRLANHNRVKSQIQRKNQKLQNTIKSSKLS